MSKRVKSRQKKGAARIMPLPPGSVVAFGPVVPVTQLPPNPETMSCSKGKPILVNGVPLGSIPIGDGQYITREAMVKSLDAYINNLSRDLVDAAVKGELEPLGDEPVVGPESALFGTIIDECSMYDPPFREIVTSEGVVTVGPAMRDGETMRAFLNASPDFAALRGNSAILDQFPPSKSEPVRKVIRQHLDNIEGEKPVGLVCPICGDTGNYVEIPGSPEIVRLCLCSKMAGEGGLLLSWQWGSVEEYEEWYKNPEAYHVEEMKQLGYLPLSQRYLECQAAADSRLDHLEPYIPNKCLISLLDIGAGSGVLVERARARGWSAWGIEPNPAYQNKQVIAGSWSDVSGIQRDVITLYDVLEHLTNPLECLLHLRGFLRDWGVLVVEMPEWDSPNQREAGMTWKHIKPKQHLCLYSDRAFRQLAEKAGLRVIGSYAPLRGSLGKRTWMLVSDSE